MAAQSNAARGKRPRRKKASPAARGEAPLSLERIVATAIGMLDAQGTDRLTMRGLADHLGSGVMSLYWHVDNKEAVFDLALDAVMEYREPPQVAEARDWRAEVILMLEDWRAVMLHHPWSASLLPTRALGPNILRRLEMLSRTLCKAGVTDGNLNVAIWSLWNYVMGATITRANFDRSDDDMAAAQQHLAGVSARYPTIERSRLLLDNDWDGVFRSGLDFLLDGFVPKDAATAR